MTFFEMLGELMAGSMLVHILPDHQDEQNEYLIQMGDESTQISKSMFDQFYKHGFLEYAGSETENDLIYILKAEKHHEESFKQN